MNKGMQNVIRAKEQESARCKVSEKELKFEDCWERFRNGLSSLQIFIRTEFEKETRALLKDSKENLEIYNNDIEKAQKGEGK